MLVPAFLYGRFPTVKAACRRMVTQIKRGVPWDELGSELGSEVPIELIDTRDLPGLLVLDGPGPLTGGGDHFHFFAPAHAIRNAIPPRLPKETFTTLFEPMIATRWGFLALLGQWSHSFFFPPGHQQRYLHAAVRWWDELAAEGPRYSTGSNVGEPLWDLFTKLKFCLAREGLPQELLSQPIPPGGMAALVAQTRAGLPPTRDQMH